MYKRQLYENEDALKAVVNEMLAMQEAAAKAEAVTQLYQDMANAQTQLATTQAKTSGTFAKYEDVYKRQNGSNGKQGYPEQPGSIVFNRSSFREL